eukprot:1364359-Amorphochlora_amoeboformis.AAC.1
MRKLLGIACASAERVPPILRDTYLFVVNRVWRTLIHTWICQRNDSRVLYRPDGMACSEH